MTPDAILTLAQSLLDRTDEETAGLWPRAAALLARQGLEAALDEFWGQKNLAFHDCSTSAQLLCLREFTDRESAGRLAHTWAALSRACHQHPYELAPENAELRAWLETVLSLVGGPLRVS
jgi:hypothetical protein